MAIPHQQGDLSTHIWGYVLDKKSEADSLWMVIDELIVINQNPKYHSNGVIKVRKDQVTQVIPRDPEAPILHFTMQEGEVIEMRRVDGKTQPVVVRLDRDDCVSFYSVSHLGAEALRPPG